VKGGREVELTYRRLTEGEICRELFRDFIRRQEVTKCWRREGEGWTIRDDPFVDDWSEEDYRFLVSCLRNTAATGGLVCGAFLDGRLKGFVSVEAEPFAGGYLDLSSIHVSQDLRGRGVGKALFQRAKAWARERGGTKLYISAHSAVESQAFYAAMGCVDARVICRKHVEAEPFDRQLECEL